MDPIHASLYAQSWASRRQMQIAQARLTAQGKPASHKGPTRLKRLGEGGAYPRPLSVAEAAPRFFVSAVERDCEYDPRRYQSSSDDESAAVEFDPIFSVQCPLCGAPTPLHGYVEHMTSSSCRGEPADGKRLRCPFCFRQFSVQAFKRHVPSCVHRR